MLPKPHGKGMSILLIGLCLAPVVLSVGVADNGRARRELSMGGRRSVGSGIIQQGGSSTGPMTRNWPDIDESSPAPPRPCYSNIVVKVSKRTWSAIKRNVRITKPDCNNLNPEVTPDTLRFPSPAYATDIQTARGEQSTDWNLDCLRMSDTQHVAGLHHNGDPFYSGTGVPVPVVVLINTIEFDSGRNGSASLLECLLSRLDPPLSSVEADADLYKLAYNYDRFPDASEAQTKRKAWRLLKYWLVQTATNGHPLLPGAFIHCVITRSVQGIHFPFSECIWFLDRGRASTLELLRGLVQKATFIDLQPGALSRGSLIFSIAQGLATDASDQVYKSFQTKDLIRRFLSEFVNWLKSSHAVILASQ
ncbi:Rho-GAP domain-containing protein [Plasmodiophora brassicae]